MCLSDLGAHCWNAAQRWELLQLCKDFVFKSFDIYRLKSYENYERFLREDINKLPVRLWDNPRNVRDMELEKPTLLLDLEVRENSESVGD